MRPDQAPDGGKFRAKAAAALDGVAGLWGDLDMLCVLINASGEIALAAAATAEGVIWTPEGKRNSSLAGHKNVIGGKWYTVFKFGELSEAEVGTSPAMVAGNKIYAAAGGDVVVGSVLGSKFIGTVLEDPVRTGGLRLVLDITAPLGA